MLSTFSASYDTMTLFSSDIKYVTFETLTPNPITPMQNERISKMPVHSGGQC